MNRWQRGLLLAIGVSWTLPNSLIGAIAGVVAIPFGARPKFRKGDLALVFHGFPLGPGGAMTLGNVMLSTHTDLDTLCTTYAHRAGWCVQPKTRIGDHERAHVLQYMALGPLFLPLYLLFGGVSVRNCFERAADRYALTGRGWWPWLKANSKAEIVRIGDAKAQ
ncbi:MAG: hypothetical protein WAZ48_10710 [Lysobacteraceae bacterium]